MQIRENQREAIRRDLMAGFILLILLMIFIGFRLIKLPLTVGISILSFLSLLFFLSVLVLSLNPALVKVTRSWIQEQPAIKWLVPFGLYLLSVLYLILAGMFSLDLFVRASLYCLLPVLFVELAAKRSQTCNGYDALLILFLWLPLELGLFAQAELPPQHSLANFFQLIGVLFILFFYFLLRELPQAGLTLHLKFKEVQLSIQNTIIFLSVALILGVPFSFLKLSHSMPGFMEMAGLLLGIFFFIALPEELLFRAVIQNCLEQKWANRSDGQTRALVAASVIFGLAHANNYKPPFIDIQLGSLGVWHFPWVYVILATLAGLVYGWTFSKTRKVTAAALVHLLVNWISMVFFNG